MGDSVGKLHWIAKDLEDKLSRVSKLIDAEDLSREVSELEVALEARNLWQDSSKAANLTQQFSQKSLTLKLLRESQENLELLLVLGDEATDVLDDPDVAKIIREVENAILKLQESAFRPGPYFEYPAIMTIRSGAGGDDASDFAAILMRMYLRYAERVKMNATVLETSVAAGAGVKTALVKFDSPNAYGNLSVESGTHRLVRISPFNAASKRQTSFVAIEVVPLIQTSLDVNIPDSDLRVDVFRSSGPGGQSVNTTDSAVRLTHLPSGISVSCQNEKSQLQNKQEALRVLQSRLLDLRRREEYETRKELAGDIRPSWGEQIRSYVLARYRMVKDLRTDYVENNPDDVFDGKLEGFISAGIKWRAEQNR